MNIEQERALLPCPFCGGTNIELQISTPDREGIPTNLMCSDCGASGPWEYEQGNSHAKADDAWNRRVALQSQDRDRLQFVADEGCHFDTYVQDDGSCKYRLVWPNYEGWEYQVEWFDTPEEAIDHARRAEGKGNE